MKWHLAAAAHRAMMAWVLRVASASASSNAWRCSATTRLPSIRLAVDRLGVVVVIGASVSSPSASPASHLSIFRRLRSALSHSVRHPPILFFNARIFLPASVVAAPFT